MNEVIIAGLFSLGGVILGVSLTYIFRRISREKNIIKLYAGPYYELVKVNRKIKNIIEIKVGGNTITGMGTYKMMLINAGNRAVENIDIKVNLVNTKLMVAEITNKDEYDNGVNVKIDAENSIRINMIFINPREYLSIMLLLDGRPSQINANYRGKNVKFLVKELMDESEFLNTFYETKDGIISRIINILSLFNSVLFRRGLLSKKLFLEYKRRHIRNKNSQE